MPTADVCRLTLRVLNCPRSAGQDTADGSVVDTYHCQPAKNEQYDYDNATGHIVGLNSGKCVSSVCGTTKVHLCIQPCTAPGVAWNYNEDGTIRPRANASACLQVASKAQDATVFVGACGASVTPQETWTREQQPGPTTEQYVGVCARAQRSGQGLCLSVDGKGAWSLADGAAVVASGAVPPGWTSLALSVAGTTATPSVNGKVGQGVTVSSGAGMVALVSGYHLALYDNFTLSVQQ